MDRVSIDKLILERGGTKNHSSREDVDAYKSGKILAFSQSLFISYNSNKKPIKIRYQIKNENLSGLTVDEIYSILEKKYGEADYYEPNNENIF